jgi:hypothetical protein
MDRWQPASPQRGWRPPPQPPDPSGQTLAAPRRRWTLAAGIVLAALTVASIGLVLLGTGDASGTTGLAGNGGGSGPAAYAPAIHGDRGPVGGGRLGFFGAGGTISAIDGSSLTVRGRDGQTVKIATTSATTYYRDTAKVNRSDLKVGDRVVVNLTDPQASSPTAGSVRVVLPSVVGTVSNLDSDSFTLTDTIGFRHTIRSSGSTSYGKDGQSSNRAAVVTAGAVVRATGTIDANGVDLTASRIDGFTPGQGGGRGPGHGRGPGYP